MSTSTRRMLVFLAASFVLALAVTIGSVLASAQGRHRDHGENPFHMEGVTAFVDNLPDGVRLTFTSGDAATVQKLQEWAARVSDPEHGRGHHSEHH